MGFTVKYTTLVMVGRSVKSGCDSKNTAFGVGSTVKSGRDSIYTAMGKRDGDEKERNRTPLSG